MESVGNASLHDLTRLRQSGIFAETLSEKGRTLHWGNLTTQLVLVVENKSELKLEDKAIVSI